MLCSLPNPKIFVLADNLVMQRDVLQHLMQRFAKQRLQLLLGVVVPIDKCRHCKTHSFWVKFGPVLDLLQSSSDARVA